MWRNEQQTNDAICLLLSRCGLPALKGLWTCDGPTEAAYDLYDANGGYLSSGERRMLLVAFDLANRTVDDAPQRVQLSDVVTLDAQRARLVLSLALALAQGTTAVDRWILDHAKAAA